MSDLKINELLFDADLMYLDDNGIVRPTHPGFSFSGYAQIQSERICIRFDMPIDCKAYKENYHLDYPIHLAISSPIKI